MQPMARLQQKHQDSHGLHMFVPDLHSITTEFDPQSLHSATVNNIRYYMAAGVDLDQPNTYVYRQSYIPAHSELAWILNCYTHYGEAQRMTQFKDKSQGPSDTISVGLFTYPVLMAADILLYDAQWVPVGDDQRQHLELTRDIAERMNKRFQQDLFVVPMPWKQQLEFANLHDGIRIRSLSNPQNKMSKSVADPKGTILLTDSPSEAHKKIMGATTDSRASITYDYIEQPGITNLLLILSLTTEEPLTDVLQTWEKQTRYGDLKKVVADAVATYLEAFQNRVKQIDQGRIATYLERGEQAVEPVAQATLRRVQEAVGLR
jgi:tryptophanyl-tRNA synthetase